MIFIRRFDLTFLLFFFPTIILLIFIQVRCPQTHLTTTTNQEPHRAEPLQTDERTKYRKEDHGALRHYNWSPTKKYTLLEPETKKLDMSTFVNKKFIQPIRVATRHIRLRQSLSCHTLRNKHGSSVFLS